MKFLSVSIHCAAHPVQVYAPAIDDNYGSVAFPGITDAISGYAKGNLGVTIENVQHEIFRVARAIDRAAKVLEGRLT